MTKPFKTADDFFSDVNFASILDTVDGVYSSDGMMSTLLDFERVLDEADLYAFKNWELGELVSGPNVRRYDVNCIFMYPFKLMPDPSGAKRLLTVGCDIKFKKTKIKVPVKIEGPQDYKPGTRYPKTVEREVWLVLIQMPKDLMNDIREGSIDLADQTIDLEDLDNAYDDNLDEEGTETEERQEGEAPADMGMGEMPPAPGAPAPGMGGM